MTITANIVDVLNARCFTGICVIEGDRIRSIHETGPEEPGTQYLMPGFIDAHVHIESSMLVPVEFARLAVRHGTVATVSDPHEISNVLGVPGIEYMLKNARQTPFKFFFGVPSCVPATTFETAGAVIDAEMTRELLTRDDLWYLSEMMNYPGVLSGDPEVMAKIRAAQALGMPVDGHAPGVTGEDAMRYIRAGITTDHECVTYEEALHKLRNGMRIAIREGSAAKNFDALYPLLEQYPEQVMLCSDDKHPDDLLVGHINKLAARAVALGCPWQNVLMAACVNPVLHYGIPLGLLRPGDPADMILVRDLTSFEVLKTWISGECVFDEGQIRITGGPPEIANQFNAAPITPDSLRIEGYAGDTLRVIDAIDGALITGELHMPAFVKDGCYTADQSADLLKIAVVNRYRQAVPAVGFIHGFGLRRGAIASSVAHDSHNIVAVGTDDESLTRAINAVIGRKGGIAATDGQDTKLMALPIAGIISDQRGEEVASQYTQIHNYARDVLGSTLSSPFMTLSFMALLVIPQLKMSDLGLFDGGQFRFVPLQV